MFKWLKNHNNAPWIILLIVVIISSFFIGRYSAPAIEPEIGVINQAWDLLFSNYVDRSKLDSANMTQAAIEAILATINDPHMEYLTKAEYDKFLESLQGQYVGIGTVVTTQNGTAIIMSVLPSSPAEKAGIKAGDTILEVNGESVAGMSLDAVAAKMRGPANTTVTLKIVHMDETAPVTMQITRIQLELPSVYYSMKGSIAYIGITQFTVHTETEIAPVISKLKEANATGIIIDLRGNTGGYLDIVVKVASHFINKGVVVKIKNSDGTVDVYNADEGVEKTDLPIVMLVDHYSASGSEILAGALQDYGRAILIGTTTYGKGSTNQLFELGDGSAVYITIARWLTPNDRLIEGQGIPPDYPMDITGNEEVQWAINYLNSH